MGLPSACVHVCREGAQPRSRGVSITDHCRCQCQSRSRSRWLLPLGLPGPVLVAVPLVLVPGAPVSPEALLLPLVLVPPGPVLVPPVSPEPFLVPLVSSEAFLVPLVSPGAALVPAGSPLVPAGSPGARRNLADSALHLDLSRIQSVWECPRVLPHRVHQIQLLRTHRMRQVPHPLYPHQPRQIQMSQM